MKTKRITLPLPTYSSLNTRIFKLYFQKAVLLLSTYGDQVAHGISHSRSRRKVNFSSLFQKVPKFNKSNLLKVVLPIFGVIVLGFTIYSVFNKFTDKNEVEGVETYIREPIDTQQIDRSLSFPITDDSGEVVTNFNYEIVSAELTDEIIVEGRRNVAIDGRMFLIVKLKIKNTYEQALSIKTRDYVRIRVDDNENELIAPDIHNDPVEVQAISTKQTRLGVALNSDVSSIALIVGEINGEKEEIKLDLNYNK